jgi:hypothetical protein
MDSIRDFKKISFREIEQAAFGIACKTQIKAMRVFLEDLDEEIYKNRDKERYESVDRKERSIDTILGMSVTFKRRYYKDRKTGNYRFLLDEVLGLPKRSKQSPLAREIAIEMAVEDSHVYAPTTVDLYERIAERHKTTPPVVEAAIRYTIGKTWKRGDTEQLNKLFGAFSDLNDKRVPTNSLFITRAAEEIKVNSLY